MFMNKKILLLTLIAFVLLLPIGFAGTMEKPTLAFDKTSYTDTDTAKITVKGEITLSVWEKVWNPSPDEMIEVSLGTKLSEQSNIVYGTPQSCDRKTACSREFTILNAGQFKNSKFYAKMKAKVDGVISEFQSDIYTFGSNKNTGPVSANTKPTVKVSLDKTSYIKGDKIKATVTGEDKDGNLMRINIIENYNGKWGSWKKQSCDSQKEKCENTWEFQVSKDGWIYFYAYARDEENVDSEDFLTDYITIKPEASKLNLVSGMNIFVIDSNFIGKSVKDFEGYAMKCDTNIRLFKSSSWEQKDRNYKFVDSDKASGLVVYCAP